MMLTLLTVLFVSPFPVCGPKLKKLFLDEVNNIDTNCKQKTLQGMEISEDSNIDSLETAQKYKLLGNEKYKAGEYQAAVGQYHRALLYIKSINAGQNSPYSAMMSRQTKKPLTSQQQQDIDQLYADCQANIAACLLNVDPPSNQRVIECCQEAIQRIPGHIKAHYRRGVALCNVHRYDESIESLRTAAKLQKKTDVNISRYLGLCQKGLEEQEKQLRNQCKAMFGSGDH